ncbi:hypothetical protein PSTG_15744 [Puccinia striiformis f. sp. tritici PST-78]|uniref:Uncharacterized protein n=1 Tax=Puccinia striiformis f. sp. tritici PST-78 TaxID=1165861 RepID=A0A0L0UUX9_9BASI|nr:hypothetical protein PSTG_15744 [Puccinia striiformis f. sp. tritici PST-78]
MPSHRRRNSLPTSYKVPITQPSFKPTAFFYDEKSATQYLKKIVRDVKSGGGIITLAQLGRLRIQFEEITHFLISNGFSTHPDEFTVYFWNCLSPQLISAMSDALIWDGHMILADIYSIETLPPYNILIQYIHRCYSSPDNPKETPSRIYITSQENQQSNQHYLDQRSMEERETEDQSPVIDIVDSSALNTPISESPTLVDIPGKVEFEGNISQNFSEEQESVLESVEETQSFNMNSVENLPEESIITEDHSFRIDNHYFPECLSQSEWEFQSILSKTSSLNLLETINPLDFIPEESFLTISEHQDYISPSPIPSSPAPTNTLKISTSQKIEEENNAQKDPGKPIESSILPIKLKSSQQESSCDPIHLPEIGIIEKDLHFVKPPGRCLNGLKPLWNFLSGCLVLLLGLSGTVCSLVVDRAGLQDISVGSGLGGNQKGGLANFFDSPVWGEPLGFAQLSDLKVKKKSLESPHRRKIVWCGYLFDTLGWLGWTWIWIRTRKKQGGSYRLSEYVDRIGLWGGRVSQALRTKGKVDKSFFDYCWNRCEVASTHVFKIFGNGIDTKGCLLVLALVLLQYFEIFQSIHLIGSSFSTLFPNSGRSTISQLSPAIGNGRYNHHQHAFGGLQLKPVACPIFRPLSRCKQPKEPQTYNFSARISLSTPAVKSGQSEQSSLWTSRWKRDRKRVIDDDYERQQRTPIKFINPTAAASSVPVRTPESDDINDDTCREILALQLIAFLDRSTNHYYYWMHPSTMSLAHESRYSDPQWTSRKLLYARSCKQTALENINNSTRKDTMELLDFHRIVCLDHLFDFCCYQPHHHDTFSTFSPDHDSEHLIAFSE